jgi:hypothetical protein
VIILEKKCTNVVEEVRLEASVSLRQDRVESPTFDLINAVSAKHHLPSSSPTTFIKQAFSMVMLTWSCHRSVGISSI